MSKKSRQRRKSGLKLESIFSKVDELLPASFLSRWVTNIRENGPERERADQRCFIIGNSKNKL